ncbi:chordopoxvirus fusion protein [bacterium]|nr:chordopoxvirus fusion protein [bacterium]
MDTIEREEIYRIAREVLKQELEILLPIDREVSELRGAIKELTQAQAKSEERLSALEKAIQELAQAQARTEARLEELAQAQARTEARLEELAQAQARTEARLEKFIAVVEEMQREIVDIKRQLGGLAHAVGFQLEDRAYSSLPRLLEEEFGIKVKERLVRRIIRTYKGDLMEINIIGKAEKDGKEIYVIGEAKANLSIRHIIDFMDRLKDIKETLKEEVFPILVTYMTDLETEEYAKSKNIRLYYSYEFQPIF